MSRENRNEKKNRARGGGPLPPPVDRLVEGLASRYLLFALGALFALDVVVPDPIPFIDEAVLGVATILLARWQSRLRQNRSREESRSAKPPPKNVTPKE